MKFLTLFTNSINRIIDFVLKLQPLFAVPLFFSVLTDTPPLWFCLIIAVIPLTLRYQQRKSFFMSTLFDIPIIVFIIGSIIGYVVAPNKDTAGGALMSTLASVLVYYGITSNSKQGKKYWVILGTMLYLICLVFSVWFFSQGQSKQFFFNQWVFDIFQEVPKIIGVSLGLHGIGALLSAVIPVLAGVILFTRNMKLRSVVIFSALLLAFTLFLSASGGGWIAAVIGLVVVLIYWKKQLIYYLLPAFSLVVGTALYFYQPESWLYKAFSIESLMARIDFWVKTIPLLNGSHAFWGLGLGNWAEIYNAGGNFHVHNNYLQIYTDMGIFAILAVVSAVISFTLAAVNMTKSSENNIAKGIAVGLIGSFLGGAFFNCLDVTLTGTIIENGSYTYLSIPFLWVWAAMFHVVYVKICPPTANRHGLLLRQFFT